MPWICVLIWRCVLIVVANFLYVRINSSMQLICVLLLNCGFSQVDRFPCVFQSTAHCHIFFAWWQLQPEPGPFVVLTGTWSQAKPIQMDSRVLIRMLLNDCRTRSSQERVSWRCSDKRWPPVKPEPTVVLSGNLCLRRTQMCWLVREWWALRDRSQVQYQETAVFRPNTQARRET